MAYEADACNALHYTSRTVKTYVYVEEKEEMSKNKEGRKKEKSMAKTKMNDNKNSRKRTVQLTKTEKRKIVHI